MSDPKDIVQRLRDWKAGASDDSIRMVWEMNQAADLIEAQDRQIEGYRAQALLDDAEIERLKEVLTTLSTDTNISQEERKFHARSALGVKP